MRVKNNELTKKLCTKIPVSPANIPQATADLRVFSNEKINEKAKPK